MFSNTGFQEYLEQAKAILTGNWKEGYTKPAPGLYPHQWNWDSGFIAMGYARYHQQRAMTELNSLFAAQWDNGMLPHIVFNPAALGNYFPEPDFWQAPQGRQTSGITMPPLHAMAALTIYRQAKDRETAKVFLKELFPKLVASHRYFYQNRDRERNGLVYIRHPWESGLDNSPSWDGPLSAMEFDKDELPEYQRMDLNHGVPAEQRPSDQDYDRYVFLVDLFRKHGYDEEAIAAESPFMVQDVLFNSILCAAGRDLVTIAEILGEDTAQLEEWWGATAKAIREEMWSEDRGQFDPRDLVAGERLPTATAASFMPLFALAASEQQARTLYDRINSVSFCALHQGNCFTIPNYDMTADGFDSKNYWRGPVWININWMLSKGLRAYGYRKKSDAMNKDMIQLPVRFGFHEYFDSIEGHGYGSDDFSWTAALFIDLVHEYYDQDRHTLSWLGLGQGRRLSEPSVLNRVEDVEPRPERYMAQELFQAVRRLKEEFFDTSRGIVNYQAMKDSESYRHYLDKAAYLTAFDLSELASQEERLAFWVNLYNIIVVHGIIELEIQESVREVSNFFTHIMYRIGGWNFSPDHIEHGILRSNSRPPYRIFSAFGPLDNRKQFMVEELDNRIHFALVCGSRSCAPIDFYDPREIDEQLNKAAENFINSSEVVLLPEKNKLMLSQIFHWYSRDFGGREAIIDFLLQYLDNDDKSAWLKQNRQQVEIEYLFYDWNLNH